MPLDFGHQYIVLMHLSLALFIRMNMIYSQRSDKDYIEVAILQLLTRICSIKGI